MPMSDEFSATVNRIMARQGIEEWEIDPEGIKADHCGCSKPENCYGSCGWHVEVKPDGTEVVYARCEPYLESALLRQEADKKIAKIRRHWGMMNRGEREVARRDIHALRKRGSIARETLEDLKLANDL